MPKMDRRKFMTVAGAAPLSLALAKDLLPAEGSAATPQDLFDPWLELNIEHLAWNVEQVRKRVENRPIMAVIKCNGYGHGLVGTAKVFEKQNIKHFAVVKAQEALMLRENGIKGTILNLGPFLQYDAEKIVKHGISQSVFSEAVDTLANAARKEKTRAKVHIKVDTGLGRVGVPYYEAPAFIEKVASMPELVIEGIFTTLTEEMDFDKIQVERLLQVSDGAKKLGIFVGLRHAASSAAVSRYPDAFLDMVRPGDCLYGLEQLPNLDLRQGMSLKTRVLFIKKMHAGETVSYHRRHKIIKETLMATIPVGYSDGYPFQAVNNGQVLIQGRRWPLVGYMSANHATVDITGSEGIKLGDEVVLFGTQKDQHISIEEVSKWSDSTVYKVAIGMNALLPRLFV